MDKLVSKAKFYSIKAHNKVNQKYGGDKSYSYHLEMVYKYGELFIHLIPVDMRIDVLCALWGHDRIEDCRETYNDIKKYMGVAVADIIYAVTDEKGRNRDERKPKKLYDGMLEDIRAKFVKIADRLANIEFSKSEFEKMDVKEQKKSMFSKLCKEGDNFKKKLYLSSNIREMIDVVGLKSSFKVFKYFKIKDIFLNTLKNNPSEPLQEMWDLMDIYIDVKK